MQLKVIGLSSKKDFYIRYTKDEEESNLLKFLRSKNIPIASSCRGEMVCQKCIVNKSVLSCSLTLKEYLKEHSSEIEVSYI